MRWCARRRSYRGVCRIGEGVGRQECREASAAGDPAECALRVAAVGVEESARVDVSRARRGDRIEECLASVIVGVGLGG